MSQLHLDKFRKRDLSWSSISSWKFSKEEWGKRYLEDIIAKQTEKMVYGNVIGKKLGEDGKFLPDVPRYKVMEHKLKTKIDEINLVGYIDSFCPDTFAFYEYKTSSNNTRWTWKSANEHGQILFYLMLIWKNYEKKPEEVKCSLHYIPVEEYFEEGEGCEDIFSDANKPQSKMRLKSGEQVLHFDIKHTSIEVLKFIKEIKVIYKEMEEFALAYNLESDTI